MLVLQFPDPWPLELLHGPNDLEMRIQRCLHILSNTRVKMIEPLGYSAFASLVHILKKYP
jgi:hypothetical protein